MPDSTARIVLLSPHGVGADHADALATALDAACAAGRVAAVILRLAPGDERGLVNIVKRLAPPAQAHGAAVLVACPGYPGDLVSVAARGGAEGVHLDKAGEADLRDHRARLHDGRILGVGGTETRHDAMTAGEAGVDYVMFGGRYPDGVAPDPEQVHARAAWWAEIFETPCIAVAADRSEVESLVGTGAEFIGLEADLWSGDAAVVSAAQTCLTRADEAR